MPARGRGSATSLDAHRARIASDQAIDWLARLRADDVTPEEQADFAEWLSAAPRNGVAFDDALTLWEGLAALPEPSDMPAAPPAAPTAAPARRWWPLTAAAAIVIACVLALTQLDAQGYSTSKGEQRRVVLEDGSTAFLNSNSHIDVDFGARVRVIAGVEGEVWFDVAADPARPFRVVGKHATAEAVGTAFAVRELPDVTRIGVTEGAVKIINTTGYKENLKSFLVSEGHQADVSAGSTDTAPFDPETALAWRVGRLEYRNVRLEDLLADLNRYVPTPMVVNDPDVADMRLSATVLLEDQAAMLEGLERVLPIKHTLVSDRLIIITKT